MSTSSPEPVRRRLPRLLGLLAVSYVICIAAFSLRAGLSRASHVGGATDGLFFSVLLATIPWLIILAPLTVACHYMQFGPERLRTLIALAPSLIASLLILSPLLTSPPTTANRFQHLTAHPLPASAQDVRMYDTGGGFDGVKTTFFFRCAAAETDDLVRALSLQPSSDQGGQTYENRPDATWPDPRRWDGRAFYSKERVHPESGPRLDDLNYSLCTDATRTQVYLSVGP